MATKSGFKEAPPTRDPSISGQAAKSRQFAAVTEPPYNILTFSATSAKTKNVKYLYEFWIDPYF